MNEYDKQCEYCHTIVSIFEGLTEFGKWFHEQCYIHHTQKELEGYKKRHIIKNCVKVKMLTIQDIPVLMESLP